MSLSETEVETPEIAVDGNRLRVFVESPEMIQALTADVRAAQTRVWIETYTLADDPTVRRLIEALKERAAAGVDCRLMYDSVGSVTLSGRLLEELKQAGVQVHGYHSLWEVFWRYELFHYFNRRNHRKLAVVDDRVAYFGGMNLVDQSGPAPLRSRQAQPSTTGRPWRDVHVRLEGPQQAEVAAAMSDLWARVHDLPQKPAGLWPVRKLFTAKNDGIYFFDSRPQHRFRRPAKIIAALFCFAHSTIIVAMAYFLPLSVIMRQLFKARKRGVDVELILPGMSDVPVVQWAARHMYTLLLRRGIRIYEREDQMLHSKAMVVDGLWSIVGSCNFDPRSLLINLEFFAVIRSEEFAAALRQICVFERSRSRAIEMRQHEQTSWWRRWLHQCAWWFRNWL